MESHHLARIYQDTAPSGLGGRVGVVFIALQASVLELELNMAIDPDLTVVNAGLSP